MKFLRKKSICLPLTILVVSALVPGRLLAADRETTAAESLLLSSADGGWDVGAMTGARQHADKVPLPHKNGHTAVRFPPTGTGGRHMLETQIDQLTTAQRVDRRTIMKLTEELERTRRTVPTQKASPARLTRLQAELAENASKVGGLRKQVSVLKAKLKGWEEQPNFLPGPGGERGKKLAPPYAFEQKLDKLQNILRGGGGVCQERGAQSVSAKQKTADIRALQNALKDRENALREASSGLADLREKMKQQDTLGLKTAADRRAYMAGVVMSQGLTERLASWHDAGVTVDDRQFRAGLKDGILHTVRLTPKERLLAQESFSRAVQEAVTAKVASAQKKMEILAKGRTPLKTGHGVVWYRVLKGREIRAGQPVTLSMTEQIAGSRVIKRVPALTLRDDDDMPAIVQEGLRLPGDGGEVVAYALARAVYGNLPLPPGVQPWTVMEYHLHGVKTGGV
ncbi:hypothetical protein [Rahnella laticis]|uniref:hypothetical protein n=1 Tax=Rahnella laticis TaxID=2787622 RepID=UPI0018A2BF8C|nr:hypothetical protein [Rahnella laticis]MBF7997770.1 hypothetical protein [Rahnella laticis]